MAALRNLGQEPSPSEVTASDNENEAFTFCARVLVLTQP